MKELVKNFYMLYALPINRPTTSVHCYNHSNSNKDKYKQIGKNTLITHKRTSVFDESQACFWTREVSNVFTTSVGMYSQ